MPGLLVTCYGEHTLLFLSNVLFHSVVAERIYVSRSVEAVYRFLL